MGGRGSSSSSSRSSNKMSGINRLFNDYIKSFNERYDNKKNNGSDNQKSLTKQISGISKINTSAHNAKDSWEFSQQVNKMYGDVKKAVSGVQFKSVPKGSVTKESKEYKERRAKGEKPLSVYTGFRENLKMNNIQSFSYTRKGESRDVSKILKKVNYFKKK